MRYIYKHDQGLIDAYWFHVLGDMGLCDLQLFDLEDDMLEILAGAWRPSYVQVEDLLILYKILELSNGRPGLLVLLKDCNKSWNRSMPIWGIEKRHFPKDPNNIIWSMCDYYKSIYDDLFFCSDFSVIDMGGYQVYDQKDRDRSVIRYSDMLRSGLFYDQHTLDLDAGLRLSFQALRILQQPFEKIKLIIDAFSEIINLTFTDSFISTEQQSWDDLIQHLRFVIAGYESLLMCPYRHVSYEMVIRDVYELCHDIAIINIPDEVKLDFVSNQFGVIMQKVWYAFL